MQNFEIDMTGMFKGNENDFILNYESVKKDIEENIKKINNLIDFISEKTKSTPFYKDFQVSLESDNHLDLHSIKEFEMELNVGDLITLNEYTIIKIDDNNVYLWNKDDNKIVIISENFDTTIKKIKCKYNTILSVGDIVTINEYEIIEKGSIPYNMGNGQFAYQIYIWSKTTNDVFTIFTDNEKIRKIY